MWVDGARIGLFEYLSLGTKFGVIGFNEGGIMDVGRLDAWLLGDELGSVEEFVGLVEGLLVGLAIGGRKVGSGVGSWVTRFGKLATTFCTNVTI